MTNHTQSKFVLLVLKEPFAVFRYAFVFKGAVKKFHISLFPLCPTCVHRMRNSKCTEKGGKFSHSLQLQSSFWARRLKKCNQFNASVIIILNSPQYQNKMAKKSSRSVFLKLGEKLYWFKIFYLDFLAKPDQYWLCFWHFKVRILLLFC